MIGDIKTSYRKKLLVIFLILFMIITAVILTTSIYALNGFSSSAYKEMEEGLTKDSTRHYKNYIKSVGEIVDERIHHVFKEQAIVADIVQKIMDNEENFSSIIEAIKTNPYFEDKLLRGANWYQNKEDEQGVILVQNYCLNEEGNIREDVQIHIDNTALLDLIIPSVYDKGEEKLWMYYSGPENASFMRVYPWVDLGPAMDSIYPEHSDKPNWEAFSPGLVPSWEKKIKEDKYKENLSELAIIKPPTQDGGTHEMIMTMNHPIWDKNREKFRGSISIDMSLEQISKYIRDVELENSGFAFISQSDGNMIAINNYGAEKMGLLSIDEATEKKETEFNELNRFIYESSEEDIKNLEFPKDQEVLFKEIELKGKTNIIILKNLKKINTWSSYKGFYEEHWTLGFIIPKEEIYQTLMLAEKAISKNANVMLIMLISVSMLMLGVVIFILKYATGRLTENLEKLTKASESLSKGHYGTHVEVFAENEFGSLANVFNEMSDKINRDITEIRNMKDELKELNDDLEDRVEERTRELKELLEKYQNAQSKLLETEKIAALGGIVGAVAHGINTPLGVSITASSHLKDKTEKMREKLSDGKIKKSELMNHMDESEKMFLLLESNLKKSSELVESFREVSKTQNDNSLRSINLKRYLDSALMVLKAGIKNKNIIFSFRCDEDIDMITYPGDWYAMFGQLIQNSIHHGFTKIDRVPLIEIRIRKKENKVKVVYKDNGHGMEKEKLDEIFKDIREEGNLNENRIGLSIVTEIIENKLGGKLKYETGKEKGLEICFMLDLTKKHN